MSTISLSPRDSPFTNQPTEEDDDEAQQDDDEFSGSESDYDDDYSQMGTMKSTRSEKKQGRVELGAKRASANILSDDKITAIKRKLRGAAYRLGGVNWKELFRTYDRDNSGEISFDEFKRAIRKDAKITQEVISDHALGMLFDRVDIDGDGKVEYNTEFLKWLEDPKDKVNIEVKQDGYFVQKRQLEAKEKRDFTLNLVKGRLRAAAYEHKTNKVEWLKLFRKHDRDESGEISYAEFKKAVRLDGRVTPQVLSEEDLRILFEAVDVDGDEVIKYETEFLAWLMPTEDEIQKLRIKRRGTAGEKVRAAHREKVSAAKEKKRLKDLEVSEQIRKINLMKQRLRAAAYDRGGPKWHKLFQHYDRDGSGFITYDEFQHAIRKLAKIGPPEISDVEMRDIFNIIDNTGDGRIGYETEFLAWLDDGANVPEALPKKAESRFFDLDGTSRSSSKSKTPRSKEPSSNKIDDLISLLAKQTQELKDFHVDYSKELRNVQNQEQQDLFISLKAAHLINMKTYTMALKKWRRDNFAPRDWRGAARSPGSLLSSAERRSKSAPSTRRLGSSNGTTRASGGGFSRSAGEATSGSAAHTAQTVGMRDQRIDWTGVFDSTDLYDLAHPLMSKGHLMPRQEQKDALAVIDKYLQTRSPDQWRGPDTPLHGAMAADHFDLFHKLLENNADPDTRDSKGIPILHVACFHGQIDFVCELLNFKADPNITDKYMQNAMFFAPTRGICQILYEHLGDINMINVNGQSALHLAAKAGLSDILMWVSRHLPRVLLDMKDSFGYTAHEYAVKSHVPSKYLKRLHPWEPSLVGRRDKTDGETLEEQLEDESLSNEAPPDEDPTDELLANYDEEDQDT